MELLDQYDRASAWTLEKTIGAAEKLDASTPCDEWDVRTLMNHMLDTQLYFAGAARGADVSPPGPNPPDILGNDAVAAFRNARTDIIEAFGADGVVEKTGPMLGIALSDQLLHGWDLAVATGQNATMPDGLAETAYEVIHGRFTDEQRVGTFGPEVPVPANAPAQDKLLAYSGRDPSAG